ncbi:hypothetical protein FDP41_002005 [Naegleria fowleri]|uniref:Uncharacterized protein n=1 Tax=Naegleria fowleri TaxID=5763 RepID=A0A6A5C047_NAEFO|nr:uncharacterized protein FDP41_002005 [Naegleria fowleri]KAF0978935.1 hypothetical protein FDP41_002005 [Naegleria fowleri]CAG4708238.1 unnamed protein product [Naegleria fowleri]
MIPSDRNFSMMNLALDRLDSMKSNFMLQLQLVQETESNRLEQVRTIFRSSPNINPNFISPFRLETGLFNACRNRHLEMAREFINHNKINPNEGTFLESPIYRSCLNNDYAITRLLLSHHRTDPNIGLSEKPLFGIVGMILGEMMFGVLSFLKPTWNWLASRRTSLISMIIVGGLFGILLGRKQTPLELAFENNNDRIISALLSHEKTSVNVKHVDLTKIKEYYVFVKEEMLKYSNISEEDTAFEGVTNLRTSKLVHYLITITNSCIQHRDLILIKNMFEINGKVKIAVYDEVESIYRVREFRKVF